MRRQAAAGDGLFQINNPEFPVCSMQVGPQERNAMSTRYHTIAVGLFAALAAAGFVSIAPAVASKPVPKTIVGCVFNGGFVSSDGYDIRPMDANGKDVDLRRFEGH